MYAKTALRGFPTGAGFEEWLSGFPNESEALAVSAQWGSETSICNHRPELIRRTEDPADMPLLHEHSARSFVTCRRHKSDGTTSSAFALLVATCRFADAPDSLPADQPVPLELSDNVGPARR